MTETKTAFVFPGQGSQYVGMGQDLCREFPEAERIFERASEALGFDIAKLCFNGPEERLTLTEYAQPAIVTCSLAAAAVLESMGMSPDFVAGHSLGEYSAVTFARGLALEDSVRLVRLRGEMMRKALPAGQGGMAAILGLTVQEVESVCREAGGSAEVANMNSPIQVVVSGWWEDLERCSTLALERGALRVVQLSVRGPFHSSLMGQVAEEYGGHLEKSGMNDLIVPLVANVDARPYTDAGKIVGLLSRQITSAVRWEESMRFLTSQGVGVMVEVGPKNVLSGLMKRIDRRCAVFTTDKPGDFEGLKSFASLGGRVS